MNKEDSKKITHPKKLAFLENYPRFKKIVETCRATAIGTTKFYGWLKEDSLFQERWEAQKREIDTARLEEYEDELDKRALGKKDARMSDVLLMFGLKSLDERYRDRQPRVPFIGDITIKLSVPERKYPQLQEADVVEGEAKELPDA